MSSFDFTMPGPLAAAFAVSLALPLCLSVVARLPFLRARNARQFLATVLLAIAAWAMMLRSVPWARPASPADVVVGAMLLGGAILVYLEVWALLSRGYTLGLLVTLYQSRKPLLPSEMADRYRGGEGIEWIERHRLGGLVAAGLVRHAGEQVTLTARGQVVAWIYHVAIAILGLRKTG
jgi:hypothetical protein